MDIYDTHAHFSEGREKTVATLARARAAGVARLMAVGGSPELNRAALLAVRIRRNTLSAGCPKRSRT